MTIDDPEALAYLRRSMVARIATLSRSGKPSITSLYFVYAEGHLWLGTDDWTLAARQIKSNPHVSVLLQIEREPGRKRILRITGSAAVKTDAQILRSSDLRLAFKYVLTPGAILNRLAYLHLRRALSGYHAQNANKGLRCVIDVTPEQIEFLDSK